MPDETKSLIPNPATPAAAGSMAVMCCGCNGLLMLDGSTQRSLPQAKHGGLFAWSAVASFATAEDADFFAASQGWKVADDDGPNHRCPECAREQAQTARRGAYVPWGGPGARE